MHVLLTGMPEMYVLGDTVFPNMEFCCYNTSNNLYACLMYYIYPYYFDMNMCNSLWFF